MWMIPVLVAVLEGLTHFGIWHGDSSGYVSMTKLFRGTASIDEALVTHWHGIVRPMVPFLAVPLSYATSYKDAIATVNLGFFVLGTFFVYLFTKKLLNSQAALISGLCFASAFPNLMVGAAVLTDGPGYAMEIVVIYFLLFVLEKKRDLGSSLLAGALIGIAVLTKETNLIILPVFLLLRFFLHRDRLTVSTMLLTLILAIAIPLTWSQLVGYNYLTFYREGLAYITPGYKGALTNPILFSLSFVYAFALCIPFAFMGFFLVDDGKFKILLEILLSAGVLLLLWPTNPEYRFAFLTFPATLPLAASGISQATQVLSRRPWFNRLGQRAWLILLLILIMIITNAAFYYLLSMGVVASALLVI